MFITFEGTEGSGKSTLIQLLSKKLNSAGCNVKTTREPGGVKVAEEIRKTILHSKMHPMTELFLYEAARAEHLLEVILPELRKKNWVLCDRFTDSTLAYQAHARGLPWKQVESLNKIATSGLTPDLTIWLDIDVAKGLARATDRNRFEEEGLVFQKKVRAGFLKAWKQKPSRWLRVQVKNQSPEEILNYIWKELCKKKKFRLKLKK